MRNSRANQGPSRLPKIPVAMIAVVVMAGMPPESSVKAMPIAVAKQRPTGQHRCKAGCRTGRYARADCRQAAAQQSQLAVQGNG